MEGDRDDSCNSEADYVCVTVTDGQLALRDQLKEYMDRGDLLAGYSFLNYFVDTYDTDNTGGKSKAGNNEAGCGRPWNERVAYMEGSGHDNRCWIIYSQGHETLPNFIGQWFPQDFIGQWFPQDNDSQLQELHAACMLGLLKPWQTLRELKEHHETFPHALHRF
ncbi:hypothetical protein L208DRAFT_1382250 [Tricholoma matsutake]|nr:hypothetical protein L208DRAFT_1382250 [Tricholoma matsutake 945]